MGGKELKDLNLQIASFYGKWRGPTRGVISLVLDQKIRDGLIKIRFLGKVKLQLNQVLNKVSYHRL